MRGRRRLFTPAVGNGPAADGPVTAASRPGPAGTVARCRIVVVTAANGSITPFAPRIPATTSSGVLSVDGSFISVNRVARRAPILLTGAIARRAPILLTGAIARRAPILVTGAVGPKLTGVMTEA